MNKIVANVTQAITKQASVENETIVLKESSATGTEDSSTANTISDNMDREIETHGEYLHTQCMDKSVQTTTASFSDASEQTDNADNKQRPEEAEFRVSIIEGDDMTNLHNFTQDSRLGQCLYIYSRFYPRSSCLSLSGLEVH